MTHPAVTTVVLAGGYSSRLGMDKTQLILDGTQTLLEKVVGRMKSLSTDVIVVSNTVTELIGARCVKDVLSDGGPLGGLYSGLRAARFSYCLVVACDMPFLSLPLLHFMVGLPRNYDVLVPRLGEGPFGMELHPLHAIYTKKCSAVIEQVLASGSRVIRDIYPKVNTVYLEKEEIGHLNYDGLSFFNINTPQDLARAKAILKDSPDL